MTNFKNGIRMATIIAKHLGLEDHPIVDIELKVNVDDVPVATIKRLLTEEEVDKIAAMLEGRPTT